MKRLVILLLITFVFICTMVLSASAGDFYEIIVAANGNGVSVYTVPRGRNVGMLFNGYTDDDVEYEKEENGWFPLKLTDDYTAWVHEKTAEAAWVDRTEGMSSEEWENLMPCSAFLGQLIEDNAVMRSKPDKRSHMIARHAAGSQFVVWGEFGSYYYVSYGTKGFISQSSILKIRDLTYREADRWWHSNDTPCVDQRDVYCEAGGIIPSDSAVRISEILRTGFINGDTVRILTYLPNDWVQLCNGSFIEARYLDPDGDHSPAKTAIIKPSKVLNRLIVRHQASATAMVSAKLCSGVEVEVVSETDDWAVIGLVGPDKADRTTAWPNFVYGCVQKRYLADDGAQVPDGQVRADVKMDILDSRNRVCASQGNGVTVIGTQDSQYNGMDSLLILGDDGTLFWMEHQGGQLEPVSYPDVKVKTSTQTALRSAPKSDSKALMTLRSGVKVQVLLRGEAWTMVKYQDTTGYVMSKHLKFP